MNVKEFNKCSGCGACVNACPADAISINRSDVYYTLDIDNSKCLDCGKCIKVCPVNNAGKTQDLIAGYYGYYNSDDVLYGSSSGGAFYALCQQVLKEGGVVFGAAFSKDKHEVLFSSTDDIGLSEIQKSKYVESLVGYSFRRIKKELEKGRRVLFCGTPCQAAGLKRYLEKDYDNLLSVDFSCGGLPSHAMYDEYLKRLEKKYRSKTKNVDFRPKNYGWKNYSIYITFENGKTYTKLAVLDEYYRSFLQGLNKRDYCYRCDFADDHASDIILADFWAFGKTTADDNKDRGLSLILTNSAKGEAAVSSLPDEFILRPLDLDAASYNIRSGHQSDDRIAKHDGFIECYRSEGFIKALKKHHRISLINNIKWRVKSIVKRQKKV